jgi:hypothetical protein
MEEKSEVITLYGASAFEESRKYLELSIPNQKLMLHHNRIYAFQYASVKYTETHVYWSEVDFKPRFNTRLFYTASSKKGLSFDKKTKDLKIWFGSIPSFTLLDSFYSYFNYSLKEELPQIFRHYVTKSLLKAIAKGKIKNIDDYATHISKHSLMFKGVQQDAIKYLIYSFHSYGEIYAGLDTLASILKQASNPRQTIDFIFAHPALISRLHLMSEWANCLEEKVTVTTRDELDVEHARLKEAIEPIASEIKIYLDPLPF